MKTFLIISSILLFAAVVFQNTEAQGMASPNFDCTGKTGYFADTYRQCYVFYYCYPDGRKLALSCPENARFNEAAGRCEINAPCSEYAPA